jgi:antibiotic biosynthesis monooxygenase (ABM) superfamily enzyme
MTLFKMILLVFSGFWIVFGIFNVYASYREEPRTLDAILIAILLAAGLAYVWFSIRTYKTYLQSKKEKNNGNK